MSSSASLSSMQSPDSCNSLSSASRMGSGHRRRFKRSGAKVPWHTLAAAVSLFSICLCLFLLKREVEYLSDGNQPPHSSAEMSSKEFGVVGVDGNAGNAQAGINGAQEMQSAISAGASGLHSSGLAISQDNRISSVDIETRESERLNELDLFLKRDVTIVICGKHSMSNTERHLDSILASTPPMPILYVIAGNVSLHDDSLAYLIQKRRQWPHLEIQDAGPLAPGYQCRNISSHKVSTKYALYMFNDVFPASKKWLQALYSFAESHEDGVAFSPFIWENSSLGVAHALPSSDSLLFPLHSNPTGELHPHVNYVKELNLDDFANDGKLYVEQVDEVEGVGDDWQGTSQKTRETPASLEDHCLLMKMSFVRETGFWDTQAGFTRQDVDLALTVRYWNRKAYIVGGSQVVYVHPSAHLKPWDMAMFAAQNSEEACGMNVVHLRHKWGLIMGQRCRSFSDSALRTVKWTAPSLPGGSGGQVQLLVASLALLGMNRFRITGLPCWVQPHRLPPLKCQNRGGYRCPVEVPWMSQATDTSAMLAALGGLGSCLEDAQKMGAGVPELWLGRNEVLLPVRLNRLLDSERGHALLNGQIFHVRKGNVRRGDKHAGRKAPDLQPLSRLYLPFMVVEAELALPMKKKHTWQQPKGSVLDGDSHRGSSWDWESELAGFSIVVQESCRTVAAMRGKSTDNSTRRCRADKTYLRAFMFVRYLDSDQESPAQALGDLRSKLFRADGGSRKASSWVQGLGLAHALKAPLDGLVKRMRMILCAPGSSEPCSLSLPLGSSSEGHGILLWAWKPQTVKTAQVLLFG